MAELRTTGDDEAEIIEKVGKILGERLDNPNVRLITKALIMISQEHATLLAENQRLRDCLAWYADVETYKWREDESGFKAVHKPISRDEGQRARETLGVK